MFLVDSAEAGSDWDGVNEAIRKILERANAEIVSIRKWDDRRLAYDIKGKARGTYILCYFKVDGQKIQGIEKGVQLSEKIMRVLILNAELMTAEDIEKDTPAAKTEQEKEQQQTTNEADQDAEAHQTSEQQEVQTAEEAVLTEEAVTAEQTEPAEEVDIAKGAEPAEEIRRSEEAEDSQKSQQEMIADD